MPDETTIGTAGAQVRALAPGQLLTQTEAAAYLGVSARYLRSRADVHVTTLPGRGARRLVRYRVADLDAWVADVNNPKSRKRAS